MKYLFFILFFSINFSTLAFSQGFDMFGRQSELMLMTIVDTGDAEKISLQTRSNRKVEIIKINQRCFEPLNASLDFFDYRKKAALVLIDQAKNIKIAIIEINIFNIKINTILVSQVSCISN